MSVRVRFAPSPTGYLHVGGARTALFNYLFAKSQKGSFILRIEDTDQERHQETAIASVMDNLNWLGLKWDEGPVLQGEQVKNQGPYAPYRQKERLSLYREHALKLIEQGKAYYCFMSPEEEALQKKQTIKTGRIWRASSPYRDLSLNLAQKKIQQGEKHCIRFKTPETHHPYVIQDLVRGEVRFPPDNLGDFILIRTEGFPVYNFSCAVDDGLMKISHIFRAEEHLPNSLKQRLVQEALGFPLPQTGHLSIILGKDRKKLSKRSGAESLEHYRKEGYLPASLLNFLALLGWNPKTEKEFFSKEELIQSFNVKGLNRSAGIFDEEKLLWLNGEHLKTLSDEKISQYLQSYAREAKGFTWGGTATENTDTKDESADKISTKNIDNNTATKHSSKNKKAEGGTYKKNEDPSTNKTTEGGTYKKDEDSNKTNISASQTSAKNITAITKSASKANGTPEKDSERLKQIIPFVRSNFKTLKQAGEIVDIFLEKSLPIKESARPVLLWPKSKTVIEKWIAFLQEMGQNRLSLEDLKLFQKKIQTENQIKGKELFWPLRCALMGQPEGMEIKILVQLLDKDQMLKRAEKALKHIE